MSGIQHEQIFHCFKCKGATKHIITDPKYDPYFIICQSCGNKQTVKFQENGH